MTRRSALAAIAGAALATIATTSPATAAGYPDHPIRLIVPFTAGGPTDVQARWAAMQIGQALGQPVVVENRGAAGGVPATGFVAHALPDGYTLLAANPGPLTVAPNVRKDLGYALKDLAPIVLIAKAPSCLAVRSALPAHDFRELVSLAKTKPGGLTYGSPGIGTVGHLTTELIASQAGIVLRHIPYRGASQVTNDLIGGQIDASVMQVGTCAPLVRQGKVRALAVTSTKRSPLLPDVPTLAEAGLKDFETSNWNGLLAPAGTPPEIVRRLRDIVTRALGTPDAHRWFLDQGYEPSGESLDAFGSFLEAETARWGRIAKSADIKEE